VRGFLLNTTIIFINDGTKEYAVCILYALDFAGVAYSWHAKTECLKAPCKEN
jgi:hypothetical protein